MMSDATLDDLIALNQEIAAFVRAGLPLELGLKGLSRSVGSRLGALSDRLAQRLANGQKLSDALADEGPAISPVYTAVVEAGLASGRLSDALQALTTSAQLLQEIRRRMFLASLYPVICLVVAYAMFCLFVIGPASRIVDSFETFSTGWPGQSLRTLVEHQNYFTQVIPSAVLVIVIVMAILRKTVARGLFRDLMSFRWVTGRSLDWSQFMEILAIQVEHGVVLPQAFVLAADSTQNRRLQREARSVSEKLNQGTSLANALETVRSLPPLVRWMLATSEKQGTLVGTLRQLCDIYRRKTLRRVQILKVWIPVVMTVFFTSLIGFSYALTFFIPLRSFLLEMMHE